MHDPIRQFIDDNRELFDSQEPGADLYGKIHAQWQGGEKKKLVRWQILQWAAVVAVLMLISAAIYFILPSRASKPRDLAAAPAVAAKDSSIAEEPVYGKQISYFQELIGMQQEELKKLQHEYPDLYHQFVTDINQLDSSYQALKIKLAVNPNREMLLEAMIQNLQLQSELLNRQLMIIKEIKQKSNNHEKSSIS